VQIVQTNGDGVADFSMSPGSITALAAIFGSLVGALGSSVSTWITQRHQDRRSLLAKKIFIARSCIRTLSVRARGSWWTR
jgi:hypothetical protein